MVDAEVEGCEGEGEEGGYLEEDRGEGEGGYFAGRGRRGGVGGEGERESIRRRRGRGRHTLIAREIQLYKS